MSSHFEDEFYTDDFDQQMMDFVAEEYGKSECNYSLSDSYLKYGTGVNYFWTSKIKQPFKYLTKQQFKEKIGMTSKTFTKADLVAGKHVVKLRGGSPLTEYENGLHLVIGDLIVNASGYDCLDKYSEDLLRKDEKENFDIIEVFEVTHASSLYVERMKLQSVWKREEKSQSQIELEKLQQQIADLQVQADKLQATL